MSPREVDRTEDQWREMLPPSRYDVLRRKGTEAPFTGHWLHNAETGMYHCGACGAALFSSGAKFDSGTGWPSFTEPADRENVELVPDDSLFMRRIEVLCKRCGSHLGHVFDDGPQPTGQRYCINSCALDFTAADSES